MNGPGLRGRGGARPGRAGVRARPAGARPGRGPRGLRRGAWRPPCQTAARSPAALRPWESAPAGRAPRFGGPASDPERGPLRWGGACQGLPGGPQPLAAPEGRPRARQRLPPPRRSCSAPRPASVCRGEGGWAGARLLLREGGGGPGASPGRAPLPPAPHALARTRPENWSPEDSKPPSHPAAKFGALLDCMLELAKKRRGLGRKGK